MKDNKKSVLVGMSGGVDSSVAIQILKDMDFEVYGITLKLFDWQDSEDAISVAKKLSIPHTILDISKEFKKEIIDNFIDEYHNGRTPNPCVLCNREVKIKYLIKYADENGLDFIATGHYARIEKDANRYLLKKSSDLKKDQSYFLHRLTQNQLSRILFPLEGMKKELVRDIADKIGLNVAQKKDSQEICFIPENDYSSFVKKNSPKKLVEGNIVDTDGNILGKHSGICEYTIGQRKGLGIPSNKPFFVVDIDARKNIIVVGDSRDTFKKEFKVKNLNWISVEKLTEPMSVNVKIRSASREIPSVIQQSNEADTIIVKVKEPIRAVTPGQSAVFYDDDTVVGGGIIVKS